MILQLPIRERALLARKIISSLDEETDSNVENAWMEGITRRYEAYKQGKVKGIPINQSIQRIRVRITMNTITILPEAKEELRSAANFYENQSPQLGKDFLTEFKLAIQTITIAPSRWPKVRGKIRRIPYS